MSIGLNLCISVLATENSISDATLKKVVSLIPGALATGSCDDIQLNVVRRPDPKDGSYGGNLSGSRLHRALQATTGKQ